MDDRRLNPDEAFRRLERAAMEGDNDAMLALVRAKLSMGLASLDEIFSEMDYETACWIACNLGDDDLDYEHALNATNTQSRFYGTAQDIISLLEEEGVIAENIPSRLRSYRGDALVQALERDYRGSPTKEKLLLYATQCRRYDIAPVVNFCDCERYEDYIYEDYI